MSSLLTKESAYGRKEEFDTKPCAHCGGAVIIYLPPYTHICNDECKRYGCDHYQFWCSHHDGVLCMYCGPLSHKLGKCNPTRQEIVEARLAKRARDAYSWQGPGIFLRG